MSKYVYFDSATNQFKQTVVDITETLVTGDILYASSATAVGRIAAVASGSLLASNGVGAVPVYTNSPSITALTLSGALTLSAMTTGSVLFAGAAGLVSQDNSNLFYNDTDNRLGVNTNAPCTSLSNGNTLVTDDGGTGTLLGGINWRLGDTANGYVASFQNTNDGDFSHGVMIKILRNANDLPGTNALYIQSGATSPTVFSQGVMVINRISSVSATGFCQVEMSNSGDRIGFHAFGSSTTKGNPFRGSYAHNDATGINYTSTFTPFLFTYEHELSLGTASDNYDVFTLKKTSRRDGGTFSSTGTVASISNVLVGTVTDTTTVLLATQDTASTGKIISAVHAATEQWNVQNGKAVLSCRHEEAQGTDVVAASTLTLGSNGNFFTITGSTGINYITTADWQNGSIVVLLFKDSPQVSHNVGAVPGGTKPIYLSQGQPFLTAAEDILVLRLSTDGTNQAWREIGRKYGTSSIYTVHHFQATGGGDFDGSLQVDGSITVNNGLTVALGGIAVTSGDVTLTAGNLDLTLGDLTLTDGNLEITSGDLSLLDGRLKEEQGADVSSGGTLTLGGDGNSFVVTGTTDIDYITTTNWKDGSRIHLFFDGALNVNHETPTPPGGTAQISLGGSTTFAVGGGGDNLTLVLITRGGTQTWIETGRTTF